MQRTRLLMFAAILLGITLCFVVDANAASKRRASSKGKKGIASKGKKGSASKSKHVARGRAGRDSKTKKSRLAKGRRRHHRFYDDVAGSGPSQHSTQIPAERVTEIQQALIKAGFLDGPPTGQYDSNTVQAMKEFQASNGFQVSGTPSASALKKLGVSKTSNDGYAVPVKSMTANSEKSSSKPTEKIKQQ